MRAARLGLSMLLLLAGGRSGATRRRPPRRWPRPAARPRPRPALRAARKCGPAGDERGRPRSRRGRSAGRADRRGRGRPHRRRAPDRDYRRDAGAQRARLAARQGPVIRLTAALQTMTRRPAALALVQPGSVRDAIHVRSLLAAIMPEVRRRTAVLRARGGARARTCAAAPKPPAPVSSPAGRRCASAGSTSPASRRERARPLAAADRPRPQPVRPRSGVSARKRARSSQTLGSRAYQERLAASLARSARAGAASRAHATAESGERIPYSLPVEGRVLVGVGEISDGGVHARGLTFETAAGAPVVAPAAGRIAYAAPFRRYGNVVIIDHGGGWSVGDHRSRHPADVRQGQTVRRGAPLGETGPGCPADHRRAAPQRPPGAGRATDRRLRHVHRTLLFARPI